MVKKTTDADFGGKSLEERYEESKARVQAEVGFIKSKMRDEFAARIMAGICAGDWKFDTSTKSWDEVAAKRAYEIADAMIKEREISNV
jgi:hypothetical protein